MKRAPSGPGRKPSRNGRLRAAPKRPDSFARPPRAVSAALAVSLACLAGCSSHPAATDPQAVSDPSIPDDQASALTLMDRLDHDLREARLDPETAAYARERLRGRLLAGNVPSAAVDSWTAIPR